MKTNKTFTGIFMIATLILFSQSIFAQPGRGMMNRGQQAGFDRECRMIPELTETQQAQIQELRTEQLKEMQDFRNQIGENRARYRTLMSADKADQKAIDANIDEYTNLRNQMMKKQAAHRQQVRSLLTDDQKVFFDNRGMRGRQGAGMNGRGMRGYGGRR